MSKRIISVITVVLVLCFTVFVPQKTAHAVYYEGSFPYSETGLTGGAFIECGSSIGDIVLVLPWSYKSDALTFTTGGNLYNATSSTITCALFHNGTQYTARFTSFGSLEYRTTTSGVQYNYIPVTTGDITDTNIEFVTDSERINDNFYFDKFQIASLSVDIAILFFVFLGWFLWHKH